MVAQKRIIVLNGHEYFGEDSLTVQFGARKLSAGAGVHTARAKGRGPKQILQPKSAVKAARLYGKLPPVRSVLPLPVVLSLKWLS